MAKKKPSTQDILAAARAEASKKEDAPSEEAQQAEGAAEAEAAAEQPVDEIAPSAPQPASTPKSTKDILAAARAQTSGGASKPAPAAGGSGKSTKDILAAARAQSGDGGGGTATAKKPAAQKATPDTKTASGERPSVQEMLKAAREGKPAEVVEPRKPAVPTKPPIVRKAPKAAPQTRRNVLLSLVATPFAFAWTLFAGNAVAYVLAGARFMMPNVLVEPPSQFKVGPASDYPFGTVTTKWKAQFGIWIIHTAYKGDSMIYALSSVCTHLGCTPNWLEGEQKFKCPCHGSGFYITGINFEGPAPRPLERVGISLAADGMLEVDKSVKFQEEMGQWEDDTSFYTPPLA